MEVIPAWMSWVVDQARAQSPNLSSIELLSTDMINYKALTTKS